MVVAKAERGFRAVLEEGDECYLNSFAGSVHGIADLNRADRGLDCGGVGDRATNEYIAATTGKEQQ